MVPIKQLAAQHGYIWRQLSPDCYYFYRPQPTPPPTNCISCIYQDYCPEPNHQVLSGSCDHYIKQ